MSSFQLSYDAPPPAYEEIETRCRKCSGREAQEQNADLHFSDGIDNEPPPFPFPSTETRPVETTLQNSTMVIQSPPNFRRRAPGTFSLFPRSWNIDRERDWAEVQASNRSHDKSLIRKWDAYYDEDYERKRDARFRKVEARREKRDQENETRRRLLKESRPEEVEYAEHTTPWKRSPSSFPGAPKWWNEWAEKEWARQLASDEWLDKWSVRHQNRQWSEKRQEVVDDAWRWKEEREQEKNSTRKRQNPRDYQYWLDYVNDRRF